MSQLEIEQTVNTIDTVIDQPASRLGKLLARFPFSGLLKHWHITLLPLILIVLVVGFLNWGLRSRIGPEEPFDTFTFPYNEAFEDTKINRWFMSGGKWSLADGALVQTAEGDEAANLFVPHWLPDNEPYRFSVDVKLSEGTQTAGINFNAQYPEIHQNHQRVYLTREDSQIDLVAGTVDEIDGFQELETVLVPSKSDSLRLDILVDESTYDVYINRQPLIENRPLTNFNGLVGLYAIGGPTSFDNLTVAAIDDTYSVQLSAIDSLPETGDSPDAGQMLYTSDFKGSTDFADWTPISGDWQVENGMLTQLDSNGFDHGIGYEGKSFQGYILQLSLQHLVGSGGGVLFNMPSPNQLNGAHMVRYSDRSEAIFWGYFDDTGAFQGQGYAASEAPGEEPHTFKIASGEASYDIYSDNELLASQIPLFRNNGHIGLITSRSTVAYGLVEAKALLSDSRVETAPKEEAPAEAVSIAPPTPEPVIEDRTATVIEGTAIRGEINNEVTAPVVQETVVSGATARISPTGPSSDIDGWVPFSGRWEVEGGLLKQVDGNGFDSGIGYDSNTYQSYTLEVTLKHLEGSGGGILFNMAAPNQLAGASMVRYSDKSDAVFWGYFDETGQFEGQGYAKVNAPGTANHVFKIESGSSTYTIYLDNQIIARDLPLVRNSGHIGLISSQSVVAFGPIYTNASGQQVTQFSRPETTGDNFFGDIRTISGDWVTEGSVIRQENPATYDFSISTGIYAGTYSLSTAITLPDSPDLQDAGGGILFHMSERGNRSGSHMVRFTGRDGILWGYYSEDGSFVGQGRADLAQSENISHTLKIVVEKDTYQIEVDDEVVALNVQLKQSEGWIGLVSYRGPITFEAVSVTLDALQ
jgi:hypothetical protein